jgi:hypothetical protein
MERCASFAASFIGSCWQVVLYNLLNSGRN